MIDVIKIVGDTNGELFLEYNGKKIAKVLDEYKCRDMFVDGEYSLTDELKDKMVEYVKNNVEKYLDYSDIRDSISEAIEDCVNDFQEE